MLVVLSPVFFEPDDTIDVAPTEPAEFGRIVDHEVLVADLNGDGFVDLAIHQRRFRGARPGEPVAESVGDERFVLESERMLKLLFDPAAGSFQDPVEDSLVPLPQPSCCPEVDL